VNRRNNIFLEPGIRLRLEELIADNFKNEEIDEIGSLLFRKYDSHDTAGAERHITISRRRAAGLLVEACDCKGKAADLVSLVVDIDGNQLLGRRIRVDGIEGFLNALMRRGYVYDPDRHRIESYEGNLSSLKNWGSLKDGREYDLSVVSVDIVGNSNLVRESGVKAVEELSFHFHRFLSRRLEDYDGRMWHWAGDGGIIAFALEGHANRAALCAIAIQKSMLVFNVAPEKAVDQDIVLRVAGHTGRVKFYGDTGKIVSDTINYAAHLEKFATRPGYVSLSEDLHSAVDKRIRSVFTRWAEFEGKGYWTTVGRLDTSFPGTLDSQEAASASY
jgi:class 3 adenylate cyclase